MSDIEKLGKYTPLIPWVIGGTAVGVLGLAGAFLFMKLRGLDPRTWFGDTIPDWLADLFGEETVAAATTLAGADKKNVETTVEAGLSKFRETCDEMDAQNIITETDLTFQGLITNPVDTLWWSVKKAKWMLEMKDIAKRCAELRAAEAEAEQRRLDEEAKRLEPLYEEPTVAPDYHGIGPSLYPEPPPPEVVQPEPPPILVWPEEVTGFEPVPPPIIVPEPPPTIICPPGFRYNPDTGRCDPTGEPTGE